MRACPSGAIDWDQRDVIEEVAVGAVIVATGHKEFDARRKLMLGYGRYDNVLTQSQLSRLLAAAGPTAGELERPSDKGAPKNILMLQCVGSRDCQSNGNEHCSAICCLFATLHASLIKQHYPDADVTICYTDLRAPGKSHEEYYRLVQARGVRYVRGRVSEIIEEPDKSLRVRFEDTVTTKKNEELFDLVVLSAGLEASDGTADIARVAGLQTAAAGFIKEYHPKLAPVDTQRTGMFLAGTAQGPKSIPDSIAQAKAAAARAISMLSTGFVLTPAQVAASDPDVCIACGVCETVCPQGAVALTTAPTRTARSTRTSAAAAASATRSARRAPSSSAASATTKCWRRRRSDGRTGNERPHRGRLLLPRVRLRRRGRDGQRTHPAAADRAAGAHALHRAREPAAHPERAGRGRRRRHGRRLPRGPVPLPRGQLQRHRPRQARAAAAQERRRRA